MKIPALKILQVSTSDISGGAQGVAWNLYRSYRSRGYPSWLAVGHKARGDAGVLRIPHGSGRWAWSRFWWAVRAHTQALDGNGRLSRLMQLVAEPQALLDHCRGVENFHYPGTGRLLQLTPRPPDIIHCHNLHGGYFDLEALPSLTGQVSIVITLHDAWLLSGHCAHSLDCERWKIGCGQCPDLTLYPPIRRDATAYNWRRKRALYERSKLYVATPSEWLMKKVEQSMLMPGVVEARVLRNGVDLTVFHPEDQRKARTSLALPQEAKILLFAANGVRSNPWKDYRTIREAIERLATRLNSDRLFFIALGEDQPEEQVAQTTIRFVPYQKSPKAVAEYYQAADIYVHAAVADTFPNTILEALACGTPVVATDVGGIGEQVKGLAADRDSRGRFGPDEATGFLTPPGDAEELALRIEQLLQDENLRQRLSRNAATDARKRFDLERQVDAYLNWYEEIRADFKDRGSAACGSRQD